MARQPAQVSPVGAFILEELEARGWQVYDLSERMGWPQDSLRRVIEGQARLPDDMAKGIGAAFGTSAELWLNLDRAFWSSRELKSP